MACDRCRRAIAYRMARRDTWRLKVFYIWIFILQLLAMISNFVIAQMADQAGFDTNHQLKEGVEASEPIMCDIIPESGACQQDYGIAGPRFDHSCDSGSLLVYSRLDRAISAFLAVRICVVLVLVFLFSYFAHLPDEQMRKILKSRRGCFARVGQAVSGCLLHVGPALQWLLYVICFTLIAIKLLLKELALCEPSSRDSVDCKGTNATTTDRTVSRDCFYNKVKNCMYYVTNQLPGSGPAASIETCSSDDERNTGPQHFFGGTDIRQCRDFIRKRASGTSSWSTAPITGDFQYLDLDDSATRLASKGEIARCIRIAVLDYLLQREEHGGNPVGFGVVPFDANRRSAHCKFDVKGEEATFTSKLVESVRCKTGDAELKLQWKDLTLLDTDAIYDTVIIPAPSRANSGTCKDYLTFLSPTLVSFTDDCGAHASTFFFYRAVSLTVLLIIFTIEMVSGTLAHMMLRLDPFILKASKENFRMTRKRPFYSMYRLFRSTMP